MKDTIKEEASSDNAKPATGLAIRAAETACSGATTTSTLMADAAAVALGCIPSSQDVQLQEHDPIRLQDFLSLRDTDVDGIVSTSEVQSAATSSNNSVLSCDSDMFADVDLTQLSPEEREKHMEMLRKRREDKKRNAVIDALDGAFGPTALLFQGLVGQEKTERVLKVVSDIGEKIGLAKMSDTGKETSPDTARDVEGKLDMPEDKEQD
ncbi:hypothetical protein C8A03DRAFT_32453 [Achaetomium macrosporum]|uniref:EF-hand domain-containing protein n=1 Tax=Achaetomium macrosporum TaxID=79813 RepID=A0AAN7CDE5_9PEZI|nr:hypothetical protein C8A03DRAFT_32453 [Achaetomium macrosporum]